eukprot:CAMPEP_0197449812 /NCGR_PEP_ID=MMETSP1175-20131217/23101_1 /TAXON_ID=1003142 /ORGANISM="Triceratium dubium, Strain CCMP147" /LENGTH=39 /DNA_ID= /DNA_START= /DNA_END= /DNA_ORIENTATION=
MGVLGSYWDRAHLPPSPQSPSDAQVLPSPGFGITKFGFP